MTAAGRGFTMARRFTALVMVTRWVLVALLCAVACIAARTTPKLGNASNVENPDENLRNRVARTLEQAGPFPAGARVVEVNSEEVRAFPSRDGPLEKTRPDSTPVALVGVDPSLLLTPYQPFNRTHTP